MSSRRRVSVLWILVVLWAGFIFFMSAHSGADLDEGTDLVAVVKRWLSGLLAPVVGEGVDVVSSLGHFCEYAVFGALLAAALFQSCLSRDTANGRRRWLVVAVAVAVASLYGVTDEFHQYFVPGRFCDPVDWLVDTVGAALGAFLVARFAFRSCSARPV